MLERISRLDPNASIEARGAAIEAVEAVPVTDPELAALRTVCLKAHRGLLEAEVTQAEVRKALDGEPPAPDTLASLEAKNRAAAATLAEAQIALSTCERLSRDATVSYR